MSRTLAARSLTALLALLLSVGSLLSPAPAVAKPAVQPAAPDTATQTHQIFLPTLRVSFPPPTALAAGGLHTCALTTAGGVLCWGNNWHSQLGDGTTTNRLTPTPVSGLGRGVAALAASTYHTCALTTVGGVLCWGDNEYGQLGDGTAGWGNDRPTPTPVSGLGSGVAALAAGGLHTCALTTAGGVLCWGDNEYGQLGDGGGGVPCGEGRSACRLTPSPVSGLGSGVAALAAGRGHTCALTTAGAVLCWGGNEWGQVGDGGGGVPCGNDDVCRLTPSPVSGLGSGVAALAAGYGHTCALTTAGALRCWGNNELGQLGDGGGGVPCGEGRSACRLTPTPVSGLGSGATALATGIFHTCALTTASGLLCWGGNKWGQVGDGGGGIPCGNDAVCRLTPAPVSGLDSGVAAISAGSAHTCALTTVGGVLCWGYNDYGQLGDGTSGLENNRPTPTPVVWP